MQVIFLQKVHYGNREKTSTFAVDKPDRRDLSQGLGTTVIN